jgi:hypothetical protein
MRALILTLFILGSLPTSAWSATLVECSKDGNTSCSALSASAELANSPPPDAGTSDAESPDQKSQEEADQAKRLTELNDRIKLLKLMLRATKALELARGLMGGLSSDVPIEPIDGIQLGMTRSSIGSQFPLVGTNYAEFCRDCSDCGDLMQMHGDLRKHGEKVYEFGFDKNDRLIAFSKRLDSGDGIADRLEELIDRVKARFGRTDKPILEWKFLEWKSTVTRGIAQCHLAWWRFPNALVEARWTLTPGGGGEFWVVVYDIKFVEVELGQALQSERWAGLGWAGQVCGELRAGKTLQQIQIAVEDCEVVREDTRLVLVRNGIALAAVWIEAESGVVRFNAESLLSASNCKKCWDIDQQNPLACGGRSYSWKFFGEIQFDYLVLKGNFAEQIIMPYFPPKDGKFSRFANPTIGEMGYIEQSPALKWQLEWGGNVEVNFQGLVSGSFALRQRQPGEL